MADAWGQTGVSRHPALQRFLRGYLRRICAHRDSRDQSQSGLPRFVTTIKLQSIGLVKMVGLAFDDAIVV